MALNTTLFFWGLCGILLPLLIHLWNRKQGKTILMGSVRWLKSVRSSRVSNIRFSRRLLFLLRALMLVLFSLLIAEPFLSSLTEREEKVRLVLAAAELTEIETVRNHLDSLQKSGSEVRLFADNFPEWNPEMISDTLKNTPDYWMLLQQAPDYWRLEDTVFVYASTAQKHFSGERPTLPFYVKWNDFSLERSALFLADAVFHRPDSLKILVGNSSEKGITFQAYDFKWQAINQGFSLSNQRRRLEVFSENEQWKASLPESNEINIRTAEAIEIEILATKEFRSEVKAFTAAFRALEKYYNQKITLNFPQSSQEVSGADGLIWLSEASRPDSLTAHFSTVIQWQKGRQELSPIIYPENGRYILSRRLAPLQNPKAWQEPLVADLQEVFFSNEEALQLAASFDLRSLPLSQVQPLQKNTAFRQDESDKQSLYVYIWFALAGLFIVERFFFGWK